MINNKEEYLKMDEAESKHWWYVSLHCLILKTIQNKFNFLDVSILDAGCGAGGLLSFLQKIQLKINKRVKIESDISLPPIFINNLLVGLVNFENKFLPFRSFGSSLFLVIKKNMNKN